MKNKTATIILSFAILANATLSALTFEETSSTSASQWKDPGSNITYNNYGSVSFKFKESVTSFAPWAKLSPPGIKAGCGGISLDAGFSAFLDLEEIGDQLEEAMSSVGMGVIVVLLQTVPSLGKAYDNVQKLIRKIQGLLQNACQTTVNMLSNTETMKNAKQKADDAIYKNEGAKAIAGGLEGVDSAIDSLQSVAACDPADSKCKDNIVNTIKMMLNPNTNSEGKISKSVTIGIDPVVSSAIQSRYSSSSSPKTLRDSLQNVLFEGKFQGNSLGLSTTNLTAAKLKMALFGYIAIKEEDTIRGTNVKDSDDNIVPEEAAKLLSGSTPVPSYAAVFGQSNNSDDIVKFLLGSGLASGEENSLNIPSNIEHTLVMSCADTTKENGCSGNMAYFQYLEIPSSGVTFTPISWKGIYQTSYETILNAVDSKKYPAPANPIGVYMPNGNKYVESIRQYAVDDEIPSFADLLAKLNVKYAIKGLIQEARTDAALISNGINNNNYKNAIESYLKNVENIENEVLKKLDDLSGDLGYLNDVENVFYGLKRDSTERRLKRVKTR